MDRNKTTEANIVLEKEPEKLKTRKKAEKTAMLDKQELHNITEKVGEIAGKGVEVLKTGAQKVSHFASSTAELSKLKVQKHSLENELHRTYLELGKIVWQMHEDGKLPKLDSTIQEKFEEIEKLNSQISVKERAAEAISLVDGA